MAKKRAATTSDSEEVKEDDDAVMNGVEVDNDNDNDNDDDEMEEEEGGDEDMEEDNNDDDDDEEDDEEDENPVGSPSPLAKKDMTLRSGRRKRRRSKETTGMTPPETIKKIKRARKSTIKKDTNSKQSDDVVENGNKKPAPAVAAATAATSPDPATVTAKNTASAVAAASDTNTTTATSTAQKAYANGSVESALDVADIVVPGGDNGGTTSILSRIARRISFSQHPPPSSDIPANNATEEESEKIAINPPKPVHPIEGTNGTNGSQIGDSAVAAVTEQSISLKDTETEEKEEDKNDDDDVDGHQIQEEKSKSSKFFTDAKLTCVEFVEKVHNVIVASKLFKNCSEIPIPEEEETTTEEDNISSTTWSSRLLWLLCFSILSTMSLGLILPPMMKLTEYLVPLDDSILPPPPKIPTSQQSVQLNDEEEEEPESIIETEEESSLEELKIWNDNLLDELKKMKEAEDEYSSSTQDLTAHYNDAMERFQGIKELLVNREEKVDERWEELIKLEDLLVGHKGSHDDPDLHDKIQKMTQQVIGKTLMATSSIALWDHLADYDTDCKQEDIGVLEGGKDETDEPRLSTQLLEEKESSLTLRSTITAEKFIGGAVAEDRVRKWVSSQITKAIKEDGDATEALDAINAFVQKISDSVDYVVQKDEDSSEVDLLVTKIVQSRLEVDRADTTGIFDHASLKNGAEIIYGGKRGTSKSLIDYLPIFNRILQNANLRFYGFGPEAALTATYPPHTLGQCWSFQQTPLKEQLKDRQTFQKDGTVPDDFKRGNFGTLTIRLPSPIYVESVVIEHPSMIFTGQSDSAIRSFRIVGHEDDMASSKAWNLGSFEYDIRKNKQNEYLQEFEVATTVFGKEIPRLHAISLAIDSNYGHEYACLYRFRVHGSDE
jgi:hypothetical protein